MRLAKSASRHIGSLRAQHGQLTALVPQLCTGVRRVCSEPCSLIVVVPRWAKLMDFETTLPSAVEELARQRDERQRA
jgi:hypothetical protein